MRRLLSASVFALIAFLPFGCHDNPASTQSDSYIAVVVDEQGQPVADVGLHFMFELKPRNQLPKRAETCPSTVIQYSIPTAGHISLSIHRWYTRQLLATLVDTVVAAGTYRMQFDFTSYTNGLYFYRLAYDTTVIERSMALITTDVAALSRSTPFARSDERGRVSIPIGMFGFDVPLLRTSGTGELIDTVYVSRSMQFVLVKEGYQTLVQVVYIKPNALLGERFVLRHP